MYPRVGCDRVATTGPPALLAKDLTRHASDVGPLACGASRAPACHGKHLARWPAQSFSSRAGSRKNMACRRSEGGRAPGGGPGPCHARHGGIRKGGCMPCAKGCARPVPRERLRVQGQRLPFPPSGSPRKSPPPRIHLLNLATIQAKMPGGARLLEDTYNNRYKCFYRGTSLSRSWPVRGTALALKELPVWAWTEARRHGEECHLLDIELPEDKA